MQIQQLAFLHAFLFLSLALSAFAKCSTFSLTDQRVWEMHVFGETNCGTSLKHESFWGRAWGTQIGCFKINVSLKGINDVKSLVFINTGTYGVKLYDSACISSPSYISHINKPNNGTWIFPNIDGGPSGYEGFVAFAVY
ncbi:hypothetical protein BJ138DRAFT_1159523 [Hygrophoropsis aurantiaca]|uniref:Uncharacterized protein n=1 Tax=Hygrophoropsis aurantiaca TaxID=72124 RepID=A0ACB8A2Q2_9AGAM|nr:hypothetical protein BJ138DRAFT_1159523 [Hygrophoropsis aurantiaca]